MKCSYCGNPVKTDYVEKHVDAGIDQADYKSGAESVKTVLNKNYYHRKCFKQMIVDVKN